MNKILLVDDDRERLPQQKSSSKWKVLMSRVHDGEQALELLDDSIDLLLLDVMMPKKNGIDTLKALRQTHQTPVIMLTAARQRALIAFSALSWARRPFAQTV